MAWQLRERLAKRYRRARWMARRAATRMRSGGRNVDALPIVFANAIPKSGSNLLFSIVRGLPKLGPFVDSAQPVIKPYTDGKPTDWEWIDDELGRLRPGDVRCGYMYASDRNLGALLRPNWANFLIIRDPRDNVVSEIFYALAIHPGHELHDHLSSLSSMEQRIRTLVGGISDGPLRRVGVAAHYGRFLPWMEDKRVCVVRFEELVSGADRELIHMLDHLEGYGFTPTMSRQTAVELLKRRMSPKHSYTFREGKSGGWREHFTETNKSEFKETAGELLVRLGYEQDFDW